MKKQLFLVLSLCVFSVGLVFSVPVTQRTGHWYEVDAWIGSRNTTCTLLIEGTGRRHIEDKAKNLLTMAGSHPQNRWRISSIRSVTNNRRSIGNSGNSFYDFYVFNSETDYIVQLIVRGDALDGDPGSPDNAIMRAVSYLDEHYWGSTDMAYWGTINRMRIAERPETANPNTNPNYPPFDVEQEEPVLSHNINRDRINISWNAVRNATEYQYQTRYENGDWGGTAHTSARTLSFDGLYGDNIINIRVKAVREKEGFESVESDWDFTGSLQTGYQQALNITSVTGRFGNIRVTFTKEPDKHRSYIYEINEVNANRASFSDRRTVNANNNEAGNLYYQYLDHSSSYRVRIQANGIEDRYDCEWEQIITTPTPVLEYEITAGKTWFEVDYTPQDYYSRYTFYVWGYDHNCRFQRNRGWAVNEGYDTSGNPENLRVEDLEPGTEYKLKISAHYRAGTGSTGQDSVMINTISDEPAPQPIIIKTFNVKLRISFSNGKIFEEMYKVNAPDTDTAGIYTICKAREKRGYENAEMKVISAEVEENKLRPAAGNTPASGIRAPKITQPPAGGNNSLTTPPRKF